ncbi:MAG: hypothetical protein WKF77_13810 [Planctomycetaceae bacterium]
MIAAIQDGEVSITHVETDEDYVVELLDGEPRPLPLPPGNYRLNNSSGVQFEFQDPEFTIVSGKDLTHPLLILLPRSWKHLSLPSVAGATATWQGELTRKSNNQPVVTAEISKTSDPKKEKTPPSKSPPGENPTAAKTEPAVHRAVTFNYKLIMTTMNEEVVEGVECRWLHVEVETFSPVKLTEEAYLAVDIAAWESGQSFKVKKGWFTVTSGDIKTELGAFSSGKSDESQIMGRHDRLIFELDPTDLDRDPLPEIALALEAALPEERLSLRDVLTLVMDANLQGSIPEAPIIRRNLGKLAVLFDQDVRIHNTGQVNCLAVLSRIETDELQFKLYRNDAIIPFGFVFVDIKHPRIDASLVLSSSFVPVTTSESETVNEVLLAAETDRIKNLHGKPRFDLATIPTEDGAWIEYEGYSELGPTHKTRYSARIEAIGPGQHEGKSGRWLKMEVNSGPDGEPLHQKETAVVLIDPVAYETDGEAVILEGWFEYPAKEKNESGESLVHVLRFDPKGDMTRTKEDLKILEFDFSAARLTVHDVMALLFNAKLPDSPSPFRQLRLDVAEKLKDSSGRKLTLKPTLLRDGTTIPGKVWDFAGNENFSYRFVRSDKIPISFLSMDLKYGRATLVARVLSNIPNKWDPSPIDKTTWATRAEETQQQIMEWQAENLNYRFWTLKATVQGGATKEQRVLAEWAGESKPLKGDFAGARRFLKPFSEEQIELGREIRISPEDEQWINQGRFWQLQDPLQELRAQYIPPITNSRKDSEEVTLEVEGEEQIVSWDRLSDDDKDWVTKAKSNWFTPR